MIDDKWPKSQSQEYWIFLPLTKISRCCRLREFACCLIFAGSLSPQSATFFFLKCFTNKCTHLIFKAVKYCIQPTISSAIISMRQPKGDNASESRRSLTAPWSALLNYQQTEIVRSDSNIRPRNI